MDLSIYRKIYISIIIYFSIERWKNLRSLSPILFSDDVRWAKGATILFLSSIVPIISPFHSPFGSPGWFVSSSYLRNYLSSFMIIFLGDLRGRTSMRTQRIRRRVGLQAHARTVRSIKEKPDFYFRPTQNSIRA